MNNTWSFLKATSNKYLDSRGGNSSTTEWRKENYNTIKIREGVVQDVFNILYFEDYPLIPLQQLLI